MHGDSDTEDSFSGDEDNEDGVIRIQLDTSSRLIQTSSVDAPSKPVNADTEIGEGEQGEGKNKQGGGENGEEQGTEASASTSKKDSSSGGGSDSSGKEEDVGDPEMAPVYLKRLLPVFTEIYHSSLAPPLRKESLRLMRKMMHYITSSCLQDLCKEATPADTSHPLFSAQISEVIAAVLENEDDSEGHLSALNIMQELLAKDRPSFDEQFVRLGLPTKIAALAGPATEEEVEVKGGEEKEEDTEESSAGATGGNTESTDNGAEEIDDESKQSRKKRSKRSKGAEKKQEDPKEEVAVVQEDATEISPCVPYQWREWCVVRSRDCLYLWNNNCSIELSSVSNGWFRFLVDNRLATMYSSGSTEGGPDSHGKDHHTKGCRLQNLCRARWAFTFNEHEMFFLFLCVTDVLVL